MIHRDPGARLTKAEVMRYRTRRICDHAKEHYSDMEDKWTERHWDTFERKSQYNVALRAERNGDGPMGKAWRTWQRARRWGSLCEIIYQQAKRRYFDHPQMGEGG